RRARARRAPRHRRPAGLPWSRARRAGRRAGPCARHSRGPGHAGARSVAGPFINVAPVLAGTLVGWLVGARLPQRLQQRVLARLGLTTLVIGGALRAPWRDTR